MSLRLYKIAQTLYTLPLFSITDLFSFIILFYCMWSTSSLPRWWKVLYKWSCLAVHCLKGCPALMKVTWWYTDLCWIYHWEWALQFLILTCIAGTCPSGRSEDTRCGRAVRGPSSAPWWCRPPCAWSASAPPAGPLRSRTGRAPATGRGPAGTAGALCSHKHRRCSYSHH